MVMITETVKTWLIICTGVFDDGKNLINPYPSPRLPKKESSPAAETNAEPLPTSSGEVERAAKNQKKKPKPAPTPEFSIRYMEFE